MIIRTLQAADDAVVPALVHLLVDVLAPGASVGFLASDGEDDLARYWRSVLAALGPALTLWVAEEEGGGHRAAGALPAQQWPPSRRRAEIAGACLRAGTWRGQRTDGRRGGACSTTRPSLLLLDTHSGSKAEHLYRRLGWQAPGSIPDFAAVPDGSLISTTYFYKRIRAA